MSLTGSPTWGPVSASLLAGDGSGSSYGHDDDGTFGSGGNSASMTTNPVTTGNVVGVCAVGEHAVGERSVEEPLVSLFRGNFERFQLVSTEQLRATWCSLV